jgi:hypothetical protein
MIPVFDANGNLPPGIHVVRWNELVARFGATAHRQMLLAGLRAALLSLKDSGCRRVYIDGSFVTTKEQPGDFDGCWEIDGVDPDKLDPVLLEFANRRAAQKAKYRGELFLANAAADPAGTRFIDFFQCDKDGHPKGIIALDLKDLP